MGADNTLNLLRQSCWFPNMGQLVTECQNMPSMCCSSIPDSTSALEIQFSTRTPMANFHADSKGLIGKKYYLHVVIAQYSKYPEVNIVSSTSFSKLEPCLDRIMATHGIPEQLTTDNGSPYFSDEMAQYVKKDWF